MAGEKTEEATPKKRDQARKKGQVARSMDVNGAVVLAVALAGLALFGPRVWDALRASMRETLRLVATPEVVNAHNVASILGEHLRTVMLSVAPLVALAMVAGICASVGQVKWKPSAEALKPDPKRMSPLQGAKNIFGPNAVFEAIKGTVKIAVVGASVAIGLVPEIPRLVGLVGLAPAALAARLADMVLDVAIRAVAAYLVIAAIDYAWQRHRHEKSIKMDKQEVKDEMKQASLPAEVKGALRRRQVQQARARMMDAVPQADVVVTNPTHFAVALAYDGTKVAPEVLAKGQDLIALQIRHVAEEHGVPVVEDKPLARGLHAAVEVGREIPEEFFTGVAQLLAFVYRTANRKVA